MASSTRRNEKLDVAGIRLRVVVARICQEGFLLSNTKLYRRREYSASQTSLLRKSWERLSAIFRNISNRGILLI